MSNLLTEVQTANTLQNYSLNRTYEGLKLGNATRPNTAAIRLNRTYEGLKHEIAFCVEHDPIRLNRTYEGLKRNHVIRIYLGEGGLNRTYEGLKLLLNQFPEGNRFRFESYL